MQTNIFPKIYEEQLNERTNEKIEAATNESARRNSSLKSKSYDAKRTIELYSKIGLDLDGVGKWLGIGFLASVILGLFVENVFEDDLSLSFYFGIIIITMIICAIIKVKINMAYNNKRLSESTKREAELTAEIDAEESKLKKEIENIKANALREQQEYIRQFEQNARDMSVQFAESDLAKEVIEWMTEGFCKTIDAADRRSHVEKILVPFVFNIYTDKITCNLGTYDFELHRCRNLSSPVEQTALARALVSAIQLNIIMKYPKDASGTDVTISIDYSYTEEHPVTTITYVAPNGNYETVKGW